MAHGPGAEDTHQDVLVPLVLDHQGGIGQLRHEVEGVRQIRPLEGHAVHEPPQIGGWIQHRRVHLGEHPAADAILRHGGRLHLPLDEFLPDGRVLFQPVSDDDGGAVPHLNLRFLVADGDDALRAVFVLRGPSGEELSPRPVDGLAVPVQTGIALRIYGRLSAEINAVQVLPVHRAVDHVQHLRRGLGADEVVVLPVFISVGQHSGDLRSVLRSPGSAGRYLFLAEQSHTRLAVGHLSVQRSALRDSGRPGLPRQGGPHQPYQQQHGAHARDKGNVIAFHQIPSFPVTRSHSWQSPAALRRTGPSHGGRRCRARPSTAGLFLCCPSPLPPAGPGGR